MSYFKSNVAYLEDSDFNQTGKLLIESSMPVVVMVQGSFCGHCVSFKPKFQEFADKMNGRIFPTTIQIDGGKTEKALGDRLQTLIPVQFRGVPMILGYKNGRFVSEYTGPRTTEGLVGFASKL